MRWFERVSGWLVVACAGTIGAACASGQTEPVGFFGSGGSAGGAASGGTGAGTTSSTTGIGGFSQGGGEQGGEYPLWMLHGRTYDQQLDYIVWEAPVAFETFQHKDGTSMPADEGGAFCDVPGGCNEQVTRIDAGGYIWGRFRDALGFRVQLAMEGDTNAGSALVEACGQQVGTFALYVDTNGLPGFVNLPPAVAAWSVPTTDPCEWRVTATGGFVHIRAIDVGLVDQPPLE